MIKHRNAENVNGLSFPSQRRAMTVAEKRDRTADWVVFKAYLLKSSVQHRPLSGTDPGPAGFDWVEIDFRRTH